MSPVKQLGILLEQLKEKDRNLAFEIQLVTLWIKEHRETRPPRIEAPSSCPDERNEYRSWRKASCLLHQRRSELKTRREKTQIHLLAVAQRINEMETGFLSFSMLPTMNLEADLTMANACN